MDIDFILQEYDDFVGMRDYERGGEFLELAAEAAGQEGVLKSFLNFYC